MSQVLGFISMSLGVGVGIFIVVMFVAAVVEGETGVDLLSKFDIDI